MPSSPRLKQVELKLAIVLNVIPDLECVELYHRIPCTLSWLRLNNKHSYNL
jgi:hypothetical protein